MQHLQFEMWPYEREPGEFDGFMSRFTDGKGNATESWWSNPCASIDHVGFGYLKAGYRHPNVKTERHVDFIKRRYREEMTRLRGGDGDTP